MLEEGVGDHGHQRMATQTSPRAAFEVVETKFFLELLVSLLADPARLDRCGQRITALREIRKSSPPHSRCELKQGGGGRIGTPSDLSALRLDDRAAGRQPYPEAVQV